jgi:hypothetical protein
LGWQSWFPEHKLDLMATLQVGHMQQGNVHVLWSLHILQRVLVLQLRESQVTAVCSYVFD